MPYMDAMGMRFSFKRMLNFSAKNMSKTWSSHELTCTDHPKTHSMHLYFCLLLDYANETRFETTIHIYIYICKFYVYTNIYIYISIHIYIYVFKSLSLYIYIYLYIYILIWMSSLSLDYVKKTDNIGNIPPTTALCRWNASKTPGPRPEHRPLQACGGCFFMTFSGVKSRDP